MRIKKLLVAGLVTVSLLLSMVQPVFADRFWTLYQLGEKRKNDGDVFGAIDAWKQIAEMYDEDTSVDGRTRAAVYWTKIAEMYTALGWHGEAQLAYKKVEYFWNALGEKDSAWGPNRIATRLKTDLRVYAKTPVTNTNPAGKFEPISGAYIGAPFDKDPKVGDDLKKVEGVYGKAHTAFLMYVRWGEPIQEWTAKQARELGGAIQLAWEPPADMKKVDRASVEQFAKKLKDLRVPVFLRYASEMNESSNPWSQNSPEVYKESFRMVADVMHKEAPNVAMVWAPLYVPMDVIPSFYPGDTAVDWVGVDAYTDRYYIGDPNTKSLIEDLYYQGYYANPMDRFEFIYNTYSAKKPIFIAETGVQNYAMNTKEDFSDWAVNNMKRLYGYLPMYYPRVKAIFYFNVDSNMVPALGLKQNYSLSRSKKVMDTYKELIKNPYFLEHVDDSVNYQYKPLEATTFNKTEKVELSSYVKILDPFVGKVDYWLDGKKIGASSNIPFIWSADFSKLTEGDHVLKVDALDSKNNINARRNYTVSVKGQKITFKAEEARYIPKHLILSDTDHWAKAQIEKLISLWSVDGYEDGTFRPERQVTRAEFYKILSNSLGIGLQVDSNSLPVIPNNHWAKRLMEGGVKMGVISTAEYNFGAGAEDKPITRAEMAMWAVRALNGGKDVESKSTSFKDDGQIPDKYKGYINEAKSIGIIDGFPDGTFRANDTATRAQAVSMIVRAVEQQKIKN